MRLLVAIAVVLSVLAAQSVVSAPVDDVDCTKAEEVIDDLGSAQGFTSRNPKYPLVKTKAELAVRCPQMQDAIKVLRKMNAKCSTGLTQQVFSASLRTRSAFNDIYCNPNNAEHEQGVEAMKCIAENSLEKVQEAEVHFIRLSQTLLQANIADEKLRIRHSCCAVLDGIKSFMDATGDKCSKHAKVYSDYMESYKSESMSLICPEVEKLECGKLDQLKLVDSDPKTMFLLTPVLKLVKTLDH